MVCYLTCGIGVALILGTLFVNLFSHYDGGVIKKYRELLTPEQDKIYKEIVRERLRLYFVGQLLGVVLGIVYLYLSKNSSSTSRICMFLFIITMTQYFYYTLSPKSKWMLDYLTTPEQTQAWLEVYKHMMKLYHLGLVVGIVGYFIVVKGFIEK